MGDFMDKNYKELLDLMFDDFDEFKDYILTKGTNYDSFTIKLYWW